jgi:hypothetical protein
MCSDGPRTTTLVMTIDIRASSDNHLIVAHDADLIRETNWTSVFSNQPGLVSQTPWSTIQSLTLLDRKGNPRQDGNGHPLRMLDFGSAVQILKSYSGGGSGPILIAEIKDTDPTVAWNDYLQGVAIVQALLPANTQQAVLFKMPMAILPSIVTIGQAYNLHPGYGHLVIAVNPADATTGNWLPGSTAFGNLVDLSEPGNGSFVNHFELNIQKVGDGATQYLNGMGGLVTSLATYYENKPYPEGVSTTYDGPTDNRNFNPGLPPGTSIGQTFCCYEPVLSNDLRGLVYFPLFYNQSSHPVSLITTGNPSQTLNLLVSLGQRNVSKIQ